MLISYMNQKFSHHCGKEKEWQHQIVHRLLQTEQRNHQRCFTQYRGSFNPHHPPAKQETPLFDPSGTVPRFPHFLPLQNFI